MLHITRSNHNPLLIPNKENDWEAKAVFNASVTKHGDLYRMVYRAQSSITKFIGKDMSKSSIGAADSADGVHYHYRRQLIIPEREWEQYGCEDPRITTLDGKNYILYTALGNWPPGADDIKIALAVTEDFKTIVDKHLLTPFNAKAGALFPQRIDGKIFMLLSVNTDNPPTDIAVISFDRESDLWSKSYWQDWYKQYKKHTLPLKRHSTDHVEVGAAPIKTDQGWLFFYSNIYNYFNPPATFTIEAVLLDSSNPLKILGRTPFPILKPQEYYELFGDVPNIVFPSGALVNNNVISIYYGAADTSICKAEVSISELLHYIKPFNASKPTQAVLHRIENNPIIKPNPNHSWESTNTYNPGAILLDNKVHLFYRAQDEKKVSTVGYASSDNGSDFTDFQEKPVYLPREDFEIADNGAYGCEDPRLTVVQDMVYMAYTAYKGGNQAQVALTSISIADLLSKTWNWETPQIISPPGMFDKNSCLFPQKIKGKFAFFHRMDHYIWLDYKETLDFSKQQWIEGKIVMRPRHDLWDSLKIGIAAPPILSNYGWVLLYHGLSRQDGKYRVGAALLEYENPDNVLARLSYPLMEPEKEYETKGERPGTVFPCGAVVLNDILFVYYGGADTYVGAATIPFEELVESLINS
jgi:predicted GH43/DUF377 family glycosyl hydrolase